MLKIRFTVPVLEELDLDEGQVETAIAEAARKGMRVQGLPKGQNLRPAHAAAAKGAEENVRTQLDKSRTGGVRHRYEER